MNSRKITHFLLFFSCFMLCFLFLNIISTQENIPHYFPSSPAKLGNNKSRRNSRANGAATQSFELNFSLTRSFIAGFQSFGMLDVRRRHGPRHNVRVLSSSNCGVAVDLMLTIWKISPESSWQRLPPDILRLFDARRNRSCAASPRWQSTIPSTFFCSGWFL